MPRGVRLTEEEKAARALAASLKPKRKYTRKEGPRLPRKVSTRSATAALERELKQIQKEIKLVSMTPEQANKRFRLKSFIGPKLPEKPKRTYVKKTPEQRFEAALKKQERLQLKALKLANMTAEEANKRSNLKSFIGPKLPYVPRAMRYTNKNFIGPLTQEQIQKKELSRLRRLQRVANKIPLETYVPNPPRRRVVKKYPSSSASLSNRFNLPTVVRGRLVNQAV